MRLLALLQTEMSDVPTLSYTSSSEIPIVSYTRGPEKGTPLGRSPPPPGGITRFTVSLERSDQAQWLTVSNLRFRSAS